MFTAQSVVNSNPSKLKNNGQILISLLIGMTLFAILGAALFTLISSSYSIVTLTRARITARHLGQERIESIRNLDYENIGTLGGIPAGSIPQSEPIERNGLVYTVETSISYIDDPFDSLAPIDTLATDYKRIRVNVSWQGTAKSDKNPVLYITDVSPPGVESIAGGGTLSILVFDANAQPVAQASVTIVSNSTNPPVNTTLQTANDGRIVIPGTPTCTDNCYQITVTKAGYSTDRTYSTVEVANPNKPMVSVLEGSLTEVSFAIDQTSDLVVNTFTDEPSSFEPLANINFQIIGSKTIGTDTFDDPVYKYVQNYSTDTNGQITISNLEWDNYQIIINGPSTGYDIFGTNPLLPITLNPSVNTSIDISLTNHTNHSLLLSITDSSQLQIASASAFLSDGVGFEASASSGVQDNPNFGQTFFANLESKIYSVTATASGYLDFIGNISVGGNTFENIILTPN